MVANRIRKVNRSRRIKLLNKRKEIALKIKVLIEEYSRYTDPEYRLKFDRPANVARQFGQLRTFILRVIMSQREKTKSTRKYVYYRKRVAKPKRIIKRLRKLEKIGG